MLITKLEAEVLLILNLTKHLAKICKIGYYKNYILLAILFLFFASYASSAA
jgi:hypothetical protein